MNDKNSLKRGLKNRHIQLIALGGAIGTGLFIAIGPAIVTAGPSVILGYTIVGLIAFLILRQLGEMVVEEPVAGSFSYFAHKYLGDFAGFFSGWNYWILYVMVSISELTIVASNVQYWWPDIPTWISALFFFTLINVINFLTVRAFGEIEFWFSIIKITTIIFMIVFGLYILLIATDLVSGATFKNLWEAPVGDLNGKNGFMPYGIVAFFMALPIIAFSFGGLEIVGITAAEAENPKKTIPKATNQVLIRILIFYIGTITILLSLHHWSYLDKTSSPFILIFESIGFNYIAGVLNFIILTAALSVFNSSVYVTSRMLFGLSKQSNAPKIFSKVNSKGVPIFAMGLTSILMFTVVPLNYFLPEWSDAFGKAMSIVVAALILNWGVISLTHLYFKKKKNKNHISSFPSLFYPYSNYLCIGFVLLILFLMATPSVGMLYSVIAIPIWMFIVFVIYKIFRPNKKIIKELNN